jgi:AmmeMemoRadiSam system protein A
MEKQFQAFGSNRFFRNILRIPIIVLAVCGWFLCRPGLSLAAAPPPESGKIAASAVPASGEEALGETDQKALLKIARETVETLVQTGKLPKIQSDSEGLNKRRGAFVTLKIGGSLRGCIGRFEPNLPLSEVVKDMAAAAATQDPRFPPVSKNELAKLHYEISVLSPLRKVKTAEEVEVGKHGVEIIKGFRGGVFLPQVATENHWDKETFLSVLCAEKAGLPPDCWRDPSATLLVFTAQVFGDEK